MSRGVERIISGLLRGLWRTWANRPVDQEEPSAAYRERDRNLRALGYEDYWDYLGSDLWERIRCEVLERHNGVCVRCAILNMQKLSTTSRTTWRR